MQHPSGKHMVDSIRLVVLRHRFERRSKPIIQIAQCNALFLQR